MTAKRSLFFALTLCLALATLFLWYGLTTPLSPQAALASAYTTTTGLRSAHVVMEITMHPLPDGAPVTQVMEGDIQFPDRIHLTARHDGETMEVVTIGRKSYIRRSGQATWETQELPPFAMPAGSAGAPVADVESVLDQMKALGNVEQLPDEMIDGVLCARYRLQVEFGRVLEQVRRRLDPEDPEVKAWLEALDRMGEEPAMRMEYWVGKQDHLVRQIQMHYVVSSPMTVRPSSGQPHRMSPYAMTMTMRFSDFDKPVHIQPPQDSSP